MGVDGMNPEIAWMDAEHARLQEQARRMKKALIEAHTKRLERVTQPAYREYLERDLERLRAIGPELDEA
jgi:hypothetical protein